MKKTLLALVGLMAIMPLLAGATTSTCLSGVIIKTEIEPAYGKNAWSVTVYDPVEQTDTTFYSDPAGSINLDTVKGRAVFSLAMAAYTAQSSVSIMENSKNNDCGSFDQVVLLPPSNTSN